MNVSMKLLENHTTWLLKFSRENYGPKVSIWSASVILYILLFGVPPFWPGLMQAFLLSWILFKFDFRRLARIFTLNVCFIFVINYAKSDEGITRRLWSQWLILRGALGQKSLIMPRILCDECLIQIHSFCNIHLCVDWVD